MAVEQDPVAGEPEPTAPAEAEPVEPAPPIESRFLFVDVAAQRAKQLRRGALPRLPELRPEAEPPSRPERFFKLERVAMEEVGRGLIHYTLPGEDGGQTEGSADGRA